MFARFDENPAMTLQDIKETKRCGRTDGSTDGQTDGQRENSIPTTNKVCGGYKKSAVIGCLRARVRKQPIIKLYLEFETVLKFYNLEA